MIERIGDVWRGWILPGLVYVESRSLAVVMAELDGTWEAVGEIDEISEAA